MGSCALNKEKTSWIVASSTTFVKQWKLRKWEPLLEEVDHWGHISVGYVLLWPPPVSHCFLFTKRVDSCLPNALTLPQTQINRAKICRLKSMILLNRSELSYDTKSNSLGLERWLSGWVHPHGGLQLPVPSQRSDFFSAIQSSTRSCTQMVHIHSARYTHIYM